jgi:hypothetical protein
MHRALSDETYLRNGAAASAILAAGAGCAAMGVMYVTGVVSSRATSLLTFYKPSGALSGQSSIAILLWVGLWITLNRLWCQRDVRLDRVIPAALVLLAVGVLLTFPPIARLF